MSRGRPILHFAPAQGWMNDPNGLVQWNGRVHLFYQHNPAAPVHENIAWGHASSADLWRWQDHPLALEPDPFGPDRDGCFSGCTVIADGHPHLLYTGVNGEHERPCLATAADQDLIRWTRDPATVIGGPHQAVAAFHDRARGGTAPGPLHRQRRPRRSAAAVLPVQFGPTCGSAVRRACSARRLWPRRRRFGNLPDIFVLSGTSSSSYQLLDRQPPSAISVTATSRSTSCRRPGRSDSRHGLRARRWPDRRTATGRVSLVGILGRRPAPTGPRSRVTVAAGTAAGHRRRWRRAGTARPGAARRWSGSSRRNRTDARSPPVRRLAAHRAAQRHHAQADTGRASPPDVQLRVTAGIEIAEGPRGCGRRPPPGPDGAGGQLHAFVATADPSRSWHRRGRGSFCADRSSIALDIDVCSSKAGRRPRPVSPSGHAVDQRKGLPIVLDQAGLFWRTRPSGPR